MDKDLFRSAVTYKEKASCNGIAAKASHLAVSGSAQLYYFTITVWSKTVQARMRLLLFTQAISCLFLVWKADVQGSRSV
jgi:hypothetical protein